LECGILKVVSICLLRIIENIFWRALPGVKLALALSRKRPGALIIKVADKEEGC
jgi:hypothetical protein